MSPAAAIAMLDRQIADHGQDVTLQRIVLDGDPIEVGTRASVQDYAITELVGGIVQGDRRVIFSPTGQTGPFSTVPVERNDLLIIDGRVHNVETANPVRIANVVVRINCQVRG
ncbi:hypothetical protein [Methylobacterium sp. Leaf108]|uniref:hypothetical protein n=1 Tax=Methylobacterium sp. Leaf108 TaxID=1736256 RepID=UPI000701D73C|nr:hypothetical protein [Methylobacterium sp. Leaf108]KQP61063.1 hypothetical protein ASF39_15420 [Methylobacterium sp. Leaf108]